MDSEALIAVRGHQYVAMKNGGTAYCPDQNNLISTMRSLPRRKFRLTTFESVLCKTCPLNPQSVDFDGENGYCDRSDPHLEEMDKAAIENFR